MKWRDYQAHTAELFRSIGCNAEIEKIVVGVRSRHEIDVWVTRNIYGLEHRWLVETKCWKTRVTKLHVAALKSIVDDVGADRGILLSSSGFQSGAISMAERSNITLSSLDDLRESVREELERYTLASLEKKAAIIADELHKLFVHESKSKDGNLHSTSRPKTGVDGAEVYGAIGQLSVLDFGFRNIKIGKNSIPIRFLEDGNSMARTNEVGVFISEVSKLISDAEKILIKQNENAERNS